MFVGEGTVWCVGEPKWASNGTASVGQSCDLHAECVYDGSTCTMEVHRDNTTGEQVGAAVHITGPLDVYCRSDISNRLNPTCEFYLPDGPGSVSMVQEGATGHLVQVTDYDAYGHALQRWPWQQPGAETNHEFVGTLGHTTEKTVESDPGLIYMQARWYDAEIGRFISMDPSRNGMNWFWYCNANPTNLVDPNGSDATPDQLRDLKLAWIGLLASALAGITGATIAIFGVWFLFTIFAGSPSIQMSQSQAYLHLAAGLLFAGGIGIHLAAGYLATIGCPPLAVGRELISEIGALASIITLFYKYAELEGWM